MTTKAGRRKLPSNVPIVPIDGISFHSEDCMHKWKYVVQRRIADEAVISDQHRFCSAILDFISSASLLPIITDVGQLYPKLIKGFIVNLPIDFKDHRTPEYQKVHVRGKRFTISPALIKSFLKNTLPSKFFTILPTP